MTVDRALNTTQVADLLGRHRNTIRKWVKAGLLPVWFYDDNGRPVFSQVTIESHQRRAGELAAERAS